MFRNFFKTAWRNLINNKVYSLLNISGLAVGMAVALLIGLWARNEISYDKFLPDDERIYKLARNFNNNGEILTFGNVSLKLVDELRRTIPEIEYVVESDWMGPNGLVVNDKKFYLRGAQANSDFLKVFKYELLQGNPNTVLKDPYSIVLTQSTAKTIFGNENPIGKVIRFNNSNDLKVTGILKDVPRNSTLQFKYIVPFAYYEQNSSFVRLARAGDYDFNAFPAYVKLKPGASFEKVSAKIKDIQKANKQSKGNLSEVILQPMQNWHLYTDYKNGKLAGGFIEYVRMFSIIGVLVLLIACINFINLTTARSEKRAREVGVRKVIGSLRRDLIIQFLAESLLLTVIAFALSVALVQAALPGFNTLTNNDLSIPFANASFWLTVTSCVLLTALIAGARPAFYLSSFRPVKVLKGMQGKAATLPRKILVVTQFTCSVALIISTIIIYKQIQYAKSRPIGFEMNRLMTTQATDDLRANFPALKEELITSGVVESATISSSPVTDIYWFSNIDEWPGKLANETVEMGIVMVEEDYFKTMSIPIQSGRDFKNIHDSTSVIFNEAAIKRLRMKDPLNQQITFNGRKYTVTGIAKDALMTSPYAPVDPTMFICKKDKEEVLIYRLSPRLSASDALVKLTAIFNKYNPSYPYDYSFADASYAAKFRQEVLIGKLAGIFAALAIFISCLGLFGLAAYIAEQRTKEIGIRKVLGASVAQVWMLLSRDFVVLVLVSCGIASPLALYFLQNWLEKYSYRISIGPGVFILAAAMAVLITVLTVSVQAVKAALANPVKSLRSE